MHLLEASANTTVCNLRYAGRSSTTIAVVGPSQGDRRARTNVRSRLWEGNSRWLEIKREINRGAGVRDAPGRYARVTAVSRAPHFQSEVNTVKYVTTNAFPGAP